MNKIEQLQQKFEQEVREFTEQEILEAEAEKKIIDFLYELRSADDTILNIFMNGSCYRLCKILLCMYPDATPLYSLREGHWVTKIGNKHYDIGGQISYDHIIEKGYEPHPEYRVTAYIPTHSNKIGVNYTKYAKVQ